MTRNGLMREGRPIIVLLMVVIIFIACLAAYVTSPSWFPSGTALRISSSSSTAESGSTLVFTATVVSGDREVAGGMITWSTDEGSLDKTTGTKVLFTAPEVTSNASVILTAKFSGEGVYQPCMASVHVMVSAPTPKTTVLIVAPNTFRLHGGYAISLNASLNPSDAPPQLIVWTLSPADTGSLSSTTGSSVTYTAPAVQTNTSVTITASYPGSPQYLASSDSAQGTVIPPEASLKNSTVVVISPPSFSVLSGGTQALTASVQDNSGNVLTGKAITWSISPAGVGTLSSGTGSSVTYTAPMVQGNSTVTILATFAGDDTYQGSRGNSVGKVTQPTLLSNLYVMTFGSATMTNVQLTGPIIVNGTRVTMLTSGTDRMSEFSLSHFGLTASDMTVNNLSLYVTYLTAYSQAFGGQMEITGGQNVSSGLVPLATFSNATLYVLGMEGDKANFTGLEARGESLNGSEPYMPSILSAQSATLGDVNNMSGPVVYGDLTDRVSNITTGTVDLSEFSFEHPIAYSLNRTSQTYNSTNCWLLAASRVTGSKVTVYSIYFTLMAHWEYPVTATGNDNITKMIPHIFYAESPFLMTNLKAHAVYFSADELTLNNFLFSIE